MNGNLNLSRAIGDLKYKGNVELPPKDQIITAQPDVRKITLQVRSWLVIYTPCWCAGYDVCSCSSMWRLRSYGW